MCLEKHLNFRNMDLAPSVPKQMLAGIRTKQEEPQTCIMIHGKNNLKNQPASRGSPL